MLPGLDYTCHAVVPRISEYGIQQSMQQSSLHELRWIWRQTIYQKQQLIGHISAADETKAKELAEEFDFEYVYASDITKKSKYSVSELKHDSMVEKYDSTEREAERPKFLLEEKETYVPDFARDDEAGGASNESKEPKNAAGVNQGALRGTAVHRVMECLDFKSLCDIDTKDHVAVSAFVKKSMDES